jgi:hypothetical protein
MSPAVISRLLRLRDNAAVREMSGAGRIRQAAGIMELDAVSL